MDAWKWEAACNMTKAQMVMSQFSKILFYFEIILLLMLDI